MDNQMEKNMENERETGTILNYKRDPCVHCKRPLKKPVIDTSSYSV